MRRLGAERLVIDAAALLGGAEEELTAEEKARRERLRLAARLHDIGKVAVSDSVLLKPGPLTVEEYDEVKHHTVLGRRLLSGVSTDLFRLAAENELVLGRI